jgi:glycosyltransferase involved in cell wall biosynthesis
MYSLYGVLKMMYTNKIIIPILVIIETVFRTLPFLVYKRKTVDDKVSRQSHTALLIPCHKAERVIAKTLESALKIFDTQSIFVIDNGPCSAPQDRTNDICAELGVNYTYVPIGNKTVAVYVGAKLAEQYQYILQIDDDMILNPDMSFPINPDTHCIAYTIGATSFDGNPKFIHKFQDLEYKMAGIIKAFESYVASATFAHGAISLWKRTSLLEVLDNHPLYPLSDDWFMGCICNSFGYRIETCDSIFTYTDVPSVYIFPDRNARETGYGGVSLFAQRFRRWYRFTHVQVWYMLSGILLSWKLPLIRALVLKVIWLWRISVVLLVMSKYVLLGIYLHQNFIYALVMLAISLAASNISVLIFAFKQLRKQERPSILVLLLFQIYRVYDSLCYMISLYTSIILMFPLLCSSKRQTLHDKKINIILNSRGTQS